MRSAEIDWCAPCPPPPKVLAEPSNVARAVEALRSAKSPLVIVGKGAAYSRAEAEVKAFVEATNLPFLPTPMGKGVVPDNHPQCVAPARSKVRRFRFFVFLHTICVCSARSCPADVGLARLPGAIAQALQSADVILLLGARLNWILHFGKPPRFRPDVRIIQVDIAAEEMHTNVPAEVALVGDVAAVVRQLNEALAARPFRFDAKAPWWAELKAKVEANRKSSEELYTDNELPMSYYRAFSEIKQLLPPDVVFVSEGANTMDIGRYGGERPGDGRQESGRRGAFLTPDAFSLGRWAVPAAQHGDPKHPAAQPPGRRHVRHHGRRPGLCDRCGHGAPGPPRRLR